MAFPTHGISTSTPNNVLFGAGIYCKNLVYNASTKEWTYTIIGASSGGGKLSISGEFVDIELDGALVKVKGLTVKQGGTATMEVNCAEISTDVLKMATMFEEGTSEATTYTMFQDKANISEGDYVENFGFVGQTADGAKNIIVIFENALCTSGLEIEAKMKEHSVIKLTMEAYASVGSSLDKLPVKIYYPNMSVVPTNLED